MKRKYLLLALTLAAFSSQLSHSQNWNEFANTSRYDKANLELLLNSENQKRVVFMGNSITEE